jgi:hypothetical protein
MSVSTRLSPQYSYACVEVAWLCAVGTCDRNLIASIGRTAKNNAAQYRGSEYRSASKAVHDEVLY